MTVVFKILSLLFYAFSISFIHRSRDGYRIADTKKVVVIRRTRESFIRSQWCANSVVTFTLATRIVRYEFQSFSLQCKLSLALRLDAEKSLR